MDVTVDMLASGGGGGAASAIGFAGVGAGLAEGVELGALDAAGGAPLVSEDEHATARTATDAKADRTR
jgi:hypothetical protein